MKKLLTSVVGIGAVVVTVGACSSTDSATHANEGSSRGSSSVSEEVLAAGPGDQAPSASALATKLNQLYDPKTTQEQRSANVSGRGMAPQLLDPTGDKGSQPIITYEVTKVTEAGSGRILATSDTRVNGEPIGMPSTDIPFILEDGQWKVDRKFVCEVMEVAGKGDSSCK